MRSIRYLCPIMILHRNDNAIRIRLKQHFSKYLKLSQKKKRKIIFTSADFGGSLFYSQVRVGRVQSQKIYHLRYSKQYAVFPCDFDWQFRQCCHSSRQHPSAPMQLTAFSLIVLGSNVVPILHRFEARTCSWTMASERDIWNLVLTVAVQVNISQPKQNLLPCRYRLRSRLSQTSFSSEKPACAD